MSVGAVAAAVVIVVVVLSLSHARGPGEQLVFPITWTPATPEAGVPWADSQIDIRIDGSGEVRDLPVGLISSAEDGMVCVGLSDELHSGPITWSMAGGQLKISAGEEFALFSPWTGPGDGADWGSMREAFCDGSYADYSARTPYE